MDWSLRFRAGAGITVRRCLSYLLLAAVAVSGLPQLCAAAAPLSSLRPKQMLKSHAGYGPIFEKLSDPSSDALSDDAIQIVEMLGLREKLCRLDKLQTDATSVQPGSTAAHDLHDEISDLKFDVLETVEETRLQIDFVVAEIEEEEGILNEAMRAFSTDRDDRVNRANILAFRTNGVLWSVAEALTIPSFKYSRLAIPSGAVGIVAGIVPSVFSAYATRSSGGRQFERSSYPNILTKLYDLPTIPRIDYPPIVWQYFNACPFGETRTRRQILKSHWEADANIHIFRSGISDHKVTRLTGNEEYAADLELISDKIIMMDEIKAATLQISRPLLEICMAARGKKHFPSTDGPGLRHEQ